MAKSKHPGGRPRLLADPEKRKEILRVLRDSGSRADAAAKVGVDYQTLLNETKRDEQFAAEVAKAESDGKISLVRTVRRAAKEDWKAAAWMLERKHFTEWSRRNPEAISPKQLSIAVTSFVNHLMGVIPTEAHAAVRSEVERFLDSLMALEAK